MRLNEEEALAYLKAEGHTMSRASWFRIKSWLKRTQLARLHHIAAIGFENKHTQRIETCELIKELMWENYNKEKSPFKRVIILEKISALQPLISAYYDSTRAVLEKRRERERERGQDKGKSELLALLEQRQQQEEFDQNNLHNSDEEKQEDKEQ